MKAKALSIGSIVTSGLAAICCIGISALGLGLAFASALLPYSNFFKVLTLVMLGATHYFVINNLKISKSTRIILWASTIVSVGLIVYSTFFGR
jgi:hypothetical protein